MLKHVYFKNNLCCLGEVSRKRATSTRIAAPPTSQAKLEVNLQLLALDMKMHVQLCLPSQGLRPGVSLLVWLFSFPRSFCPFPMDGAI